MEITLQHLALALSRVPQLGPRGTLNILTRRGSWPDVFSASAKELEETYKLRSKAAEYLSANASALLKESGELHNKVTSLGIRIITVCDNQYPTSLKVYQNHLPPVIYAYGNIELFQERKFAVVNSSTVGDEGAKATTEIAGLLIDEGLAPVTGHNNIPYQLVMLAAKRRNVPSVVVLDRGIINAFHGSMDWQPVAAARIWDPEFDPARDVVISQFRLGDRWIGENSRQRDRMIFGLADVVIAGEVREGGVMHKEILFAKERGRELLVCSFSAQNPAGNAALLEAGCQALDVAESSSMLIPTLIAPMFEGKTDDLARQGEE